MQLINDKLGHCRVSDQRVVDRQCRLRILERVQHLGPMPVLGLTVVVPGEPTGTVFNGGAGFQVVSGMPTTAARFLFASEDGTISGWNPTVSPPQAMVVFTSPDAGASYKGLAIALNTVRGDVLYAADFHNAHVDIIGADLQRIAAPAAFVDPGLPAGYAQFGIQNINGSIFVSYAKQDADAEEEVAGAGSGSSTCTTPPALSSVG